MIITDQAMLMKMERALRSGNDLYDLDDIQEKLIVGDMQSHVEGNTWAVTEVHDWPRRRSVNILFVVGYLGDSLRLEKKIIDWAKDIGADLITAIGRDGWWEYRTPGWKKMGTLYSKDI